VRARTINSVEKLPNGAVRIVISCDVGTDAAIPWSVKRDTAGAAPHLLEGSRSTQDRIHPVCEMRPRCIARLAPNAIDAHRQRAAVFGRQKGLAVLGPARRPAKGGIARNGGELTAVQGTDLQVQTA
jgi:hypothetical protein